MFSIDDLRSVLVTAQELGFLGDRPIDEVIDHATAFVRALDEVHGVVVDLGAGGGVPGLVVAQARPDLELVMIDRRSKRTDHLDRIRRRHRLGQVTVRCEDVARLVEESPGGFDAVIARGFGPPTATLTFAATLIRPEGRIVISEPPPGTDRDDRWTPALLDRLQLERLDGPPGVAVFGRRRTS